MVTARRLAFLLGALLLGGGCGSGVVDGRQPTLIDDLEDGDSLILPGPGRSGVWFPLFDSTWIPSTAQPGITGRGLVVRNDRAGSRFAAHFRRLVGGWGGGMGISFAERSYDGSPYSGVTFLARRDDDAAEVHYANFPNLDTHSVVGKCVDVPDVDCDNHFACRIRVTPDWQRFAVFFDELAQAAWPDSFIVDEFKPSEMKDITFTVRTTPPMEATMDLWLDDLSFIRRGEEDLLLDTDATLGRCL